MIKIEIHVDEATAAKMTRARKAVFNRYILGLVAFLMIVAPIAVTAAPISLPNTFSSGTTISSSAVNQNFTTLLNGINAIDTRMTAAEGELDKTLATPNGIMAYAGTSTGTSTLTKTYNSTGGTVTASGTNGNYQVRFGGINCGGSPGTGLAIASAAGASGISCRVNGDWGNDSGSCRIYIGCYNTSGSLTATPFSLIYVK